MSSRTPKVLELRVCRLFGGQRRGPLPGSDCVGTPFAVEVKRTKNRVPEGHMIAQAERQGKAEGLPWVLVIAGHNDRKPIATLELSVLLDLCQRAGVLREYEPRSRESCATLDLPTNDGPGDV